jgi:hypothetical protein
MVELTATGAEVEAATAVDVARAATAELEALRTSSTSSSVSTDDDRDNELKLTREAAREQAAQWAAAHPKGAVAIAQMGMDAPTALKAGVCATVMPRRRWQPRQARTHRQLG